jgi:hypothetical protein
MQIAKRWSARPAGLLVMTSCLAIWNTTAWAQAGAPAYRSGITGHVVEGPITPVCRPGVPCTRPFANATIQVVDSATRNTAGTAVTNRRGNFRVEVPPGSYLVHVQVVDFPRCPEVQAVVRGHHYTAVRIDCDTGIR